MAQRKTLLEEIVEQRGASGLNQSIINSAPSTVFTNPVTQQASRPTLLEEIVASRGMGGLNESYVTRALRNNTVRDFAFEAAQARRKREEFARQQEEKQKRLETPGPDGIHSKTSKSTMPREDNRSAATRAIDRFLGIDKRDVTGGDTKAGELLKGAVSQGLNQANVLNWKSANMIEDTIGKPLGRGVDMIMGKGFRDDIRSIGRQAINSFVDVSNTIAGTEFRPLEEGESIIDRNLANAIAGEEAAKQKYSANANTSRAAQVVNRLGTDTVATLPVMLFETIAALSGGGVPQIAGGLAGATSKGLGYASSVLSGSGNTGTIAVHALGEMLSKPGYWTSMMQTLGQSYEDALAEGMSETDASIYALTNGAIGSMIEVGGADEALGGVQSLPRQIRDAFASGDKRSILQIGKRLLGSSAVQEGLEEVQQGFFERGLMNVADPGETPEEWKSRWISTDINDTRAAINPWTMAQEFTGGATVGALLGGGQIVTSTAAQKMADNMNYRGNSQSLINEVKQNGTDEQVLRAAELERAAADRRGGRLKNIEAGELYGMVQENGRAGAYQEEQVSGQMRNALDRIFSVGNVKLNEKELDILSDGYVPGSNVNDYIAGTYEAYRLGREGTGLEEARENAKNAKKMLPQQFEHAWTLGRQSGAVDTATEEGKAKLGVRLASLGVNADAAVDAYESTQDVRKYAAEMNTAVALASAGADIASMQQQQKSDGKTSGLAYLTDAQIAVAAEIGAKMQSQRQQLAKQKAARFAALQDQIAEGRMPADMQQSLKEVRNYLGTLQQDIRSLRDGLQEMIAADPAAKETATYKAIEERIREKEADAAEARDLIEKIKAAGGEAAGPRKGRKGRMVYARQDGTAGGIRYKAVDRSKLSKTQKSAARVSEVIARVSGLNIMLADFGKNVGGEYFRGTGGTIYLNINASFDGKNITIASLTHELTHFLQEYAPEQYEELKAFVLQEMARNPEEFESIFRTRMGRQQNLTPDQLTDEMVANACMTVLQDDAAVRQLVQQHQTLAERIRDFILKFVDDLKSAFSEIDTKDNFTLYREVRAAEGALDEIRERWLNAFTVASENLQNEAETKNTAPESGEVQYLAWGEKEGVPNRAMERITGANRESILSSNKNVIAESHADVVKAVNEALTSRSLQKTVYFGILNAKTLATIQNKATNVPKALKGNLFVPNAAYNLVVTYDDIRHMNEEGNLSIDEIIELLDRMADIIVENDTVKFSYYGKKGQKQVGLLFEKQFPDGTYGAYELTSRGRRRMGMQTLYIEGRDSTIKKEPSSSAVGDNLQPTSKTTEGLAPVNTIPEAAENVNMNDPVALEEFAEPAGVQYSIFVEDPETLQWLDEQEKAGKVVTTYKSFLEIDGKLYPPMASMKKDENGKWKMTKAMEAGRWEESVGDPSKVVVDPKNGRGYYILKKDNGDTVKAAYNPYQHSSNLMLNDQFTGAYDRPKLVTYECIIPESELTSGYRAQYAKDAVGVHSWKAGPVAGKLVKAKGTERQVYLSRWLKPVRKVPDAEVAQHYKKLLDGTDIAVPSNVVPPSLLEALEDAGVRIQYTKQAPKRERTTTEENGQMRLQFQMLSDVEETDRLVAVHNKSVSGLRRMLKRGGVPFPSIAIKKAGSSHEGFGDVSIVFPRSTIDPEVNRQNRIYSNDAWTPTEPATEYDVGNTWRYAKKLRAQIGDEIFLALKGGTELNEDSLARRLQSNKGDIVETLKGITLLKYAYLDSIGKAPKIPGKAQSLDGFGKYGNEQLLAVFDALSENEIENLDYGSEALQKVADALNEQFREKFAGNEKALSALMRKPLYEADSINPHIIKDAYRKYKNNGNSVLAEYDYYAFNRQMSSDKELEDSTGYRKWLEDNFSDLIVDSGIRNNVDLFTPSGNRRSFKQLHKPATLENIVKIMQQEQEKGVGIVGVNLRGAATKSYRTVEEARAERGKLLGEHIADKVYDGYMKGFYDRLHGLSERGAKNPESWQSLDAAQETMLEAIRDAKNKAQMRALLRKEAQWFNYSDSLVDDLWELRNDVQNMPAPYFEAKPRRVVYPREALAYILPNSEEAADVVRELEANGYNVLVYEAGNEADRLAKLNSVEGAQFQTWNGDQAMLDEFSDVHPDFQRRIDEANELTEDLVKYFRNVTGENALEEDEIRELMEQNLYNRKLRGDIPDSAEILETLSKISQVKNGKGRMQAFELMERILPHLDESTQQLWISRTEENRNEAFAKWYNKKHPSLYYPGYQPGDLFKNGTAYSGTIPWGNLHKERGYLHKLINSGELVEPELSMAKDFLARLMNPNGEVFYQQWDDAHNDWAPTFYSQMEKTINEWTNEKGRPMPAKMAANAVIPWLRGRGVKAEEIRWAGLQPWLEGRKSVTQEELQAFMAENQTNIQTKVLKSDLGEEYWSMDGSNFVEFDRLMEYAIELAEDEGFEPGTVDWEPASYYSNDRRVIYGLKDGEAEPILYVDKAEGGAGETQWFDYSTEGGTNYREVLFKLPGLEYSNNASMTHWGSIGEDAGTIAHARIQDLEDTGGRRVLFIEEIQSDLHNEGARLGFQGSTEAQEELEKAKKLYEETKAEYDAHEIEAEMAAEDLYSQLRYYEYPDEQTRKNVLDNFTENSILLWLTGKHNMPLRNSWFKDGSIDALEQFHKILAEDKQLSDDLSKLAQKGKRLYNVSQQYYREMSAAERDLEVMPPDVPFAGSADTYHEYVMKHLLREAAEGNYDGIGWTSSEMQSERWSDQYAEGYRIEYDQNIPKFMRKYLKQWGGKVETTKLGTGDEVWYAAVNDEMRKAVLEVGQPMFQQWDDTYDDTEEEESGRWEAYSRMQAEQAILDEALTGVRELTKKEKKTIAEIQKRLRIGKDPEVRMKDARKLAKQLITDQNSTADIDEIAADIKYMGDYLLQSGDPTTTVLSELARETAYKIASTAEEVVDDNEAEVFQNIRSSIKGAKITVDPAEAGDIGGVESLNEFRKQNFGRFTVVSRDSNAATKQGYISVEQLYDDLHGEFGDHYFPEAGSDNGPANGGEMLRIIADMYDAAEPMTVNPNEQYMGEAVESIAHDITFAVLNDALQMESLTMSENVRAELLDTETSLPQKTRQQAADLLKQGEELEEANKELQVKEKQATARAEVLQAKNEGLEARNRQIRKDALQAAADQKQQNQESAAEIRRLQSEVKQLSKKLDKATARYKTLQDDARERVARVRREGTARAQERAAKERAKKYEKLAELKEHYQEMERAARERRHSSELRGKIRRLIDKLNAKLARPSEKKHVPRELVQLTVDVLKMIDVGARAGVRMRDKLAQIRTMYESYEKNPTYSMVYDEQTAEMLKNLQEKIGDGNIYKMTESQLQAVYQTLKSLNHVIEEAVRIRIGDEERNAFEVAQEMTAETRAVPKAQKGWGRAKYLIAHLRPDVAFRRFAWFKKNSTWESMARMLNDGQLKQTGIQMKLSRPFAELINNGAAMRDFMGMNAFGRVDPDKLIDIGLEDKDGKTIKVTHGIALGIWFDLQNEQNKKHFIRGGKTIPNLNDYYGGKGGFKFETQRSKGISTELSDLYHQIREAKEKGDDDLAEELKDRVEMVKLSGENYADKVRKSIEDQMTDFDRAWIRETQHLMNVEAKRYLNETTMEVYGIEKAGVDNYYPITSDPNFLSTPFESITKNMNLENAGFMKERIESGNPTLALDISSVVNDQIRRVAQYSGLMPAIRNFNKVYNKMSYGYSDSLKKALNDKFGDAGTGYIEDLIADLTGSRNEGEDSLGINRLLGSLRGNLAQTTLTLNLRVAMSQAASYPTAAAELGWKPLAKALRKGGKDGRMISRADQELIATYSPLLWLRMQGYSTVELGDIKNSQKLMARFWKKMRWATGWIQAVDGATVGRLWSASEYWVDDHMPYLQKGSDEYYQEVAKKFNDVVEKTQPNYTTMQRPAMLRDPRGIVKMVTMFMTQRLQNFNLIFDSTAAYQKARADLAAKRNGVTEADVKEAKTQMVLAVTSQLAQAATFVAFKFIADALLRNLKGYRDDEDGELTAQSISMQILDNYVDAMMGSFWLGSELYTIAKAVTGNEKWYGLSLSGVDSLNDLVDDIVAMLSEEHDLTTEKGRAKFMKKLASLAGSVAQAMGLPLNNAAKIGKAVAGHVEAAIKAESFSGYWDYGYEPTKAQQKVRTRKELGVSDKLWDRSQAADADSNNSITQDEIGAWLQQEIAAGSLTQEEAEALWKAHGSTWKKTFADWSGEAVKKAAKEAKAAATPAAAKQPEDDGYKTFKRTAPIYGGQEKEASYAVWEKYLKPNGMSLERFTEILSAADTDRNDSLKQDELGYALRGAIQNREMTDAQASAVWNAQGWKTDFWKWSSKH